MYNGETRERSGSYITIYTRNPKLRSKRRVKENIKIRRNKTVEKWLVLLITYRYRLKLILLRNIQRRWARIHHWCVCLMTSSCLRTWREGRIIYSQEFNSEINEHYLKKSKFQLNILTNNKCKAALSISNIFTHTWTKSRICSPNTPAW